MRHPSTTSRVPLLPAWRTISFSMGISASPPRARNVSHPGIWRPDNVPALQRRSVRSGSVFSSALKAARPDSMRCWIKRFSSVLVMCIYSAPIGPAVGLFERVEQLAQLHRLFAAGKEPTLKVSWKSASVKSWKEGSRSATRSCFHSPSGSRFAC